jgi:hypothetical protein
MRISSKRDFSREKKFEGESSGFFSRYVIGVYLQKPLRHQNLSSSDVPRKLKFEAEKSRINFWSFGENKNCKQKMLFEQVRYLVSNRNFQ